MASYLLSRSAQKRAFFAFNIIFWVLGLGSLLIGLWSYVTKQSYVDLIPSSYGTLSAIGLCIAAGLTVIIIAFVGCLGVWTESRLLLLAYIFFVLLLLAVQFIMSTIALNYQSDIYQGVRSDMEQSLKYHQEFLCCGVDGPADWFSNQKWSNNSYVPDSCCNKIYFNSNSSMKNCGKDKGNWDLWFQRGCSEVYTNWIFEEIKVAAYIAIVFICIELFLLVLVLLIFRSIRRSRMSYNCTGSTYHYSKGVNVEVRQEKAKNSSSLS
uniref:Tetraspanin n=1 Tax=Onchocerca volvulus TaxID=6282 RepID=A0A8R1TW06_ONCVO